jgi:hypothetical protein
VGVALVLDMIPKRYQRSQMLSKVLNTVLRKKVQSEGYVGLRGNTGNGLSKGRKKNYLLYFPYILG